MYIAEQLPRQATARLKVAAFGRARGEEASHVMEGSQVTVTFLRPHFNGGTSRHTISLEQFKSDFAVIRTKKAGR